MTLHFSDLPDGVQRNLRQGVVIPAHPLALDESRQLDETRQRALTRYYVDAGAGGMAVGVHTTQFAIREQGLYEKVLGVASRAADEWSDKPFLKVAGVTGKTAQALAEAEAVRGLGYHAALLNVAAFRGAREEDILEHCRKVANIMPVIGFYLTPEVGGIFLSKGFWHELCRIENVVAIKAAPFNRYWTGDVVRGIVEAEAEDKVTLYTGNDDHIVLDLLSPYKVMRNGEPVTLRAKGGLLGHWSFWTQKAVEQLERIHREVASGVVSEDLLALDFQVTDANNAIYDGANGLKGCIPGCQEILRRQGLLGGTWCLDTEEVLSPGQSEEISRVYDDYPELNDDEFVKNNLNRWLSAW